VRAEPYSYRATLGSGVDLVVKSEGVRDGHSGQAIKLEAHQNSFSFSAPKMGYLVIFGFFSFSAENGISFSWGIFVCGRKR